MSSSTNESAGVVISKDEATGEWWVFLTDDCSEIEFQAALRTAGAMDAELVEFGLTEGGQDYMVFEEPRPVV